MQPATTATDPESRPLTMLTQKPRFSTGKTWPAPALEKAGIQFTEEDASGGIGVRLMKKKR